jgi:putative aldouronate transport system permease protein
MFILVLVCIIFIAPFLYVFSASFSSPIAIAAKPIFILPQQFTLATYKIMMRYSSIATGYLNSIFYTVVGTFINISFTITGAYALTRPELKGRRYIMFLIILTMFINAGMIPSYLLVRDLGMLNTRWALLLPGAVAQWNLFIAKSYIEINIPSELHDAAEVDGAGEFTYFFRVVLPLSGAIITVLALFYGAGHWNAFFGALIYLRDRSLYPLSLVLREILIQNQIQAEVTGEIARDSLAVMGIKYAVVVISVAPLLITFPFTQKHFVKGVMVGSLKG